LTLLGGKQAVIESPMLQKMIAEAHHKDILALLKARFGTIPRDVTKRLQNVLDEEKLTDLNVLAGQSPDLETFRRALRSRT
jgi:hypothetical protein